MKVKKIRMGTEKNTYTQKFRRAYCYDPLTTLSLITASTNTRKIVLSLLAELGAPSSFSLLHGAIS
jgi:hypothetical protein